MEMRIEEKLFFKMMLFNKIMKHGMTPGPHGPHGHHGPHSPHPEHGPHGPHGPFGRPEGPCSMGPGPHGPHEMGPMHGPCDRPEGHGPHGPHGHHGPGPEKMRGFAQARLLSLMLDHENGVRQKVLAEEMNINPSSTSELIGKLESEGYVVRTVDPDDKRATLITLTEVGKARACELEDERAEKFEKIFQPLTSDEKEQLLTILDKLLPTPEE